jgi:glutamine synthetase
MSFLFNNEENDNAYSILEYIWFDSNGVFRSKTRILYVKNINTINQIPKWNYDGSSTNQLGNVNNSNTEIILSFSFFGNLLKESLIFITSVNSPSIVVA